MNEEQQKEYVRPFTCDWVILKTASKIKESIDLSIGKTFERQLDFEGDTEKQSEVFKTLSILHNLRKQIDDIEKQCRTREKERANVSRSTSS